MALDDKVIQVTVSLVAIAVVAIPLGLNQLHEVQLHEDTSGAVVTIVNDALPAVLFAAIIIGALQMMR